MYFQYLVITLLWAVVMQVSLFSDFSSYGCFLPFISPLSSLGVWSNTFASIGGGFSAVIGVPKLNGWIHVLFIIYSYLLHEKGRLLAKPS